MQNYKECHVRHMEQNKEMDQAWLEAFRWLTCGKGEVGSHSRFFAALSGDYWAIFWAAELKEKHSKTDWVRGENRI